MSKYAQLTLDGFAAEKAKIIAINQVEANADPTWLDAAYDAVRYLCAKRNYWTTDAVWERLDQLQIDAPHEPRALGAVMRKALKEGLIMATGKYLASERPECHANPKMVWRSVK